MKRILLAIAAASLVAATAYAQDQASAVRAKLGSHVMAVPTGYEVSGCTFINVESSQGHLERVCDERSVRWLFKRLDLGGGNNK